MSDDPTGRFTDRVDNYVKYRPGYPPAILAPLQQAEALTAATVVADIGCGPGRLTRLLLDQGCLVYGVEPNEAMRAAAVDDLVAFDRFLPVAGRAEATTQPDRSIDLITAGQAFHWFEPWAARREFRRILRPDGWLLLVWNERLAAASPFQAAYEALVRRHALDLSQTRQERLQAVDLPAWFGPAGCQEFTLPNPRPMDLDGLIGRTLSSSYSPLPGHPHYQPLLDGLRALFGAYETEGRVTLHYVTRVYIGRLSS